MSEKNGKASGTLKIGVKDFGPISSGGVEVRPLTVLIGPNNSGKSYFSMLLHSVLESLIALRDIYLHPGFSREYFNQNIDLNAIMKEFPEVFERIDNLNEGDEFEFPRPFINRVSQGVFDDVFERQLNNELMRSYACRPRELIRNNKRAFSIAIHSGSLEIILNSFKSGLKIKKYPKLKIDINVKRAEKKETRKTGLITRDEFSDQFDIKAGDIESSMSGVNWVFYECCEIVANRIRNEMFIATDDIINDYLPAARSGILQGHKAMVADIVRKAPYAGVEKFEIPKFSGVVSDFMSSLIEMTDEKGPLYDLAVEFEQELIHGEVALKFTNGHMSPEIKYRFKDKEISLHRASSTVYELAPLFLYLKYKLEPGGVLIIEEPEAHLHPRNQRILAKYLVRLIRAGVKLVVTTHSDYLLDQLSSYIMLSRVKSKKQREALNFGKDDYLEPDEIGVNVFQYDKKSGGYKIRDVEISAEDGISQEEYVKVNEALYEESIKIREHINPAKG